MGQDAPRAADWRTWSRPDGWRGLVLSPWHDALAGPDGWLEQLIAGQLCGEILKARPQRRVIRVRCGEFFLYVKQHRPAGWLRQAAEVVRHSAAAREAAIALRLQALHIPVVQPLAWLERTAAGLCVESLLITLGVPEARTLRQVLREDFSRSSHSLAEKMSLAGRALARALGQFLASLHQAGVDPLDLHLENLLVTPPTTADEKPGIWLVDLAQVRTSVPFSLPTMRDRLGRWAACCDAWATADAKRSFWRAYRQVRPEPVVVELRAFEKQVDQRAAAHARSIACGRDRRCWRTNADAYTLRTADGWARAASTVSPAQLADWLRQPPRAGDRLDHVGPQPAAIDVREFPPWSWSDLWQAGLWQSDFWLHSALRSPAEQCWAGAFALRLRGLACPQPLALLRPVQGAERIVLMNSLPQNNSSEILGDFLAHPQRECDAERLGQALGRFHRFGGSLRPGGAASLRVLRSANDTTLFFDDPARVRFGRTFRADLAKRDRQALGLAHSPARAAFERGYLLAHRPER